MCRPDEKKNQEKDGHVRQYFWELKIGKDFLPLFYDVSGKKGKEGTFRKKGPEIEAENVDHDEEENGRDAGEKKERGLPLEKKEAR